MEKIIKITGFSDKEKKDKSGTFPCFEVISSGQKKSIGVFEKDAVEELKKHMFEWVKVVMEERPNGYENITHFVGLAKPEEIPSTADSGLPAASHVEHIINEPADLKPANTKEVEAKETIVRYIHEIITDNRKNSMECGKATERVKIYFDTTNDFAKQYEEVIIAKRAIDSRLNTDDE